MVRFILFVVLFILCNLANIKAYGSNDIDYLKKLLSKDEVCIINQDFDLDGDTIQIPIRKSLDFEKGSISNGCVIFNQSLIVGKKIKLCDVSVLGTIRNSHIESNWFPSTLSNNDNLCDVIKLACESSCDFVFNEGKYTFTKPIAIYGKCNMTAKGHVVIHSLVENCKVFLIAGNSSIGGKKPITWTGVISGIDFVANKGTYDSFLGLYNVKDVEVSNCRFDLSHESVNCHNKIISSVNNANYSNPSKGRNIKIQRNIIRYQSSIDNRNNCECIGVEARDQVLIADNIIYNSRDDLGIHKCTNVEIRNNIINSYDGRIFISNSKNVVIDNNTLKYVFPSTTGMGIYVGVESGYNPIPEYITIKNNTVDYFKAKNTPCYGIRIIGANYVTIEGNKVFGHPSARIAIEYAKAKPSQSFGLRNEGILVPEHIIIKENECNGLWLAGYAKLKVNDIQILNNLINGIISVTNKDVIFLGNKYGKSTRIKALPTH